MALLAELIKVTAFTDVGSGTPESNDTLVSATVLSAQDINDVLRNASDSQKDFVLTVPEHITLDFAGQDALIVPAGKRVTLQCSPSDDVALHAYGTHSSIPDHFDRVTNTVSFDTGTEYMRLEVGSTLSLHDCYLVRLPWYPFSTDRPIISTNVQDGSNLQCTGCVMEQDCSLIATRVMAEAQEGIEHLYPDSTLTWEARNETAVHVQKFLFRPFVPDGNTTAIVDQTDVLWVCVPERQIRLASSEEELWQAMVEYNREYRAQAELASEHLVDVNGLEMFEAETVGVLGVIRLDGRKWCDARVPMYKHLDLQGYTSSRGKPERVVPEEDSVSQPPLSEMPVLDLARQRNVFVIMRALPVSATSHDVSLLHICGMHLVNLPVGKFYTSPKYEFYEWQAFTSLIWFVVLDVTSTGSVTLGSDADKNVYVYGDHLVAWVECEEVHALYQALTFKLFAPNNNASFPFEFVVESMEPREVVFRSLRSAFVYLASYTVTCLGTHAHLLEPLPPSTRDFSFLNDVMGRGTDQDASPALPGVEPPELRTWVIVLMVACAGLLLLFACSGIWMLHTRRRRGGRFWGLAWTLGPGSATPNPTASLCKVRGANSSRRESHRSSTSSDVALALAVTLPTESCYGGGSFLASHDSSTPVIQRVSLPEDFPTLDSVTAAEELRRSWSDRSLSPARLAPQSISSLLASANANAPVSAAAAPARAGTKLRRAASCGDLKPIQPNSSRSADPSSDHLTGDGTNDTVESFGVYLLHMPPNTHMERIGPPACVACEEQERSAESPRSEVDLSFDSGTPRDSDLLQLARYASAASRSAELPAASQGRLSYALSSAASAHADGTSPTAVTDALRARTLQCAQDMMADIDVSIEEVSYLGAFCAVFQGSWRNKQVCVTSVPLPFEKGEMEHVLQTMPEDTCPDHAHICKAVAYSVGRLYANSTGASFWRLNIVRALSKATCLESLLRYGALRRLDPRARLLAALGILSDTASALVAAHDNHCVHGALSPWCIFISSLHNTSDEHERSQADLVQDILQSEANAQLVDFGLLHTMLVNSQHYHAQASGEPSMVSTNSESSGVLFRQQQQSQSSLNVLDVYGAPEVARHNNFSSAGDIYSFGVLMWELANGSPVCTASPMDRSFACTDVQHRSLRRMSLNRAFPEIAPHVLPPSILTEYTQLMLECLHADLDERPTADMLSRSLQEIFDSLVFS